MYRENKTMLWVISNNLSPFQISKKDMQAPYTQSGMDMESGI